MMTVHRDFVDYPDSMKMSISSELLHFDKEDEWVLEYQMRAAAGNTNCHSLEIHSTHVNALRMLPNVLWANATIESLWLDLPLELDDPDNDSESDMKRLASAICAPQSRVKRVLISHRYRSDGALTTFVDMISASPTLEMLEMPRPRTVQALSRIYGALSRNNTIYSCHFHDRRLLHEQFDESEAVALRMLLHGHMAHNERLRSVHVNGLVRSPRMIFRGRSSLLSRHLPNFEGMDFLQSLTFIDCDLTLEPPPDTRKRN